MSTPRYLIDRALPQQQTAPADLTKQKNVDRIFRAAWLMDGVAVVQFVPARPVVLLCLGPNDQTGGLIVRSPELGGPGTAYVGVNAPWFGRLTQPFTVETVLTAPLLGDTVALDLLAFYELPPVVPVRGPFVTTGTLSSGAGTAAVRVATFGRKRIRVMCDPPGGGAANFGIYAFAVHPGLALVGNMQAAGGAAVNESLVFEFDSARTPVAPLAFGQNVPTSPDYVTLSLLTAGRTVDYNVSAWDY